MARLADKGEQDGSVVGTMQSADTEDKGTRGDERALCFRSFLRSSPDEEGPRGNHMHCARSVLVSWGGERS